MSLTDTALYLEETFITDFAGVPFLLVVDLSNVPNSSVPLRKYLKKDSHISMWNAFYGALCSCLPCHTDRKGIQMASET